ncbi:MAG TPA: SIS domain-containing protein [Erysipelothrix sp.]|jgi:6-phospho-3-hexuloisomerase|nr:SIS domain-containing protein [Erysipelothrix sp.]
MNTEVNLIIKELEESMSFISTEEIDFFIEKLQKSRRVIVVGVGRVMISLKSWVKRFNHLEVDINYFGSETEENVNEDDLIIIASSSGESLIPVSIAKKAKSLGTKVYYIGCTKDSSVFKMADYQLLLKGKTKFNLENEFESQQPMSTLFEQQLMILGDAIALRMIRLKDLDIDEIKLRHANLE